LRWSVFNFVFRFRQPPPLLPGISLGNLSRCWLGLPRASGLFRRETRF